MRSTLVLCTKNGGERLLTCLSHIEALDAGPDFDLVLVDNNSDDGTSWPALQEFGRTTRHACQVIQCTRPGNSAGRNDGIRVARGEILLFIDDDCYVAPDFVKEWKKTFTRKQVDYGTGRIMCHDPDPAVSKIGCRETTTEMRLQRGQLVRPGFVQGSNMAFTRQCLARIGLFDERFGSGTPFAGEDWDIALRACFAKMTGGYFPEPTVSHDHRRLVKDIFSSREKFYEYGAGAVYAKHMNSTNFFPVSVRFSRHIKDLLFRDTHRKELIGSLLKGWYDYYRTLHREEKRVHGISAPTAIPGATALP